LQFTDESVKAIREEKLANAKPAPAGLRVDHRANMLDIMFRPAEQPRGSR